MSVSFNENLINLLGHTLCRTLDPRFESQQCFYLWVQVCVSKRHNCHSGYQDVKNLSNPLHVGKGACKQGIPLALRPTSPEVQNRSISGQTKGLMSSNNKKKNKQIKTNQKGRFKSNRDYLNIFFRLTFDTEKFI